MCQPPPLSGPGQDFLPSLEDLLSIIEGMHDNVAIVDRSGVIRWVSQCFERTYGIKSGDIVGRTTYEMERQKVFNPSVSALVLKTRRVITVTEVSATGQYNIVTGIPIYDDEGLVHMVVSFSVDLRYSIKLHDEYENIIKLMQGGRENFEPVPGVVAVSPAMQAVLHTVTKVAGIDISLLITGESGVGKNVIARLAHQLSERHQGPFVEINCAGIPEALLESELFGYEAGAFTGALVKGKPGRIAHAHGGTLFLDEVGELPLGLQAKLLQVIQEKHIVPLGGSKPVSIDFRLITATNQNLEMLVEKKFFRSDLFFRLNVMPITMPPLRQRSEDILPLCANVLDKLATRYNIRKRLSPAVEARLLAYAWPGNVRELNNVLERMIVVAEGSVMEEKDLPDHIRASQAQFSMNPCPPPSSAAMQRIKAGESVDLGQALEHMESQLVLAAYAEHGTTTATAKALGISQPSAARKIRKYQQRGY